MNNIDNLKNVQEKVFRWCEANPLSTKMLVAWILSDMFAVSHTLVGSLDVRMWYSLVQGGYFSSGMLAALLDAAFAYFLFRRLKWARIVGMVIAGCAVGSGVWQLFGCIFGGLDSFVCDILLSVLMLCCDCAAFLYLWQEMHDPGIPSQKTAAHDWAALAGYVVLSVAAGIVILNKQTSDAEAIEYMKQAAVEGGASARSEFVEWVMENNEGIDKKSAREAVEGFIEESKAESEAAKDTVRGRLKARKDGKNLRGTVFLYLFALLGPFIVLGWGLNKYGVYKKSAASSADGESVEDDGSPDDDAQET